jgi:hypothetical protein
MKRSKSLLIIIFKNVIECFRAKRNRQKIKRTLEDASERLRMAKERFGTLNDAEGTYERIGGDGTVAVTGRSRSRHKIVIFTVVFFANLFFRLHF